MKKRNLFAVALAAAMLLSLLTGCGSSSKGAYSAAYDNGMMYESAAEESWSGSYEAPMAAGGTKTATTQSLPENRKWVITMDVSTETEDMDAALEATRQKIAELGGYVENQNIQNGSSYASRRYRDAYMTIRIPAAQVDAFLESVGEYSNVTSSSKNVRDITLTYTDTESRINALRTEEARLLELMAQAADMSDLLEIESRLTEVRYELESYSSQLRRYDNQVDYATVNLSIEEVQQYTPVAKQTFWQRITSGLADSMDDLADSIVDVAVWLIVSLPYLAVMALFVLIIVLVVRWISKRSEAKKAAKLRKQYALYQQQKQQEQQEQEKTEE